MLKVLVFLITLWSCCSALKYETFKVRVAQSAVDYINSEIRAVIPTIESELQNFPLPQLSGDGYRLHNLRLHSSNIGSSSINFQDNGVRVRLDNNHFVFGGSFWIKKIIGIKGKVKITASNFGVDTTLDFNSVKRGVSLQYCRVYIGRLNINLYNPLLNFILGLLEGAIRNQARRIICDVIKNSAIPSINKAISNLPADYNVGEVAKIKLAPGNINVNSDQLISSFFAEVQPVTGKENWKYREQALPAGGYTGQCCFWASEYLLNTALGTLMAPGKLQTTLDAAQMGGLPAALTVDIANSAAPVLTLNSEKVYLSTSVNVSMYGEEAVNLGHYSTDFYLSSDTHITYEDVRRVVRDRVNYQLPALQKQEECVDNHKDCAWWAGRGECKANPNYMLNWCKKSCKVCTEDDVSGITNPVEYLLNKVLPSREYVQFYHATSDMLKGASRTCGKFRPTEKTRQLVHEQIREFLRAQRT